MEDTRPEGNGKGSGRKGNLKNLTGTWKKGQSGNPAGMKPGTRSYATVYREALIRLAKANNKTAEDIEYEILQKGIQTARAGDYRFYKDLLDRQYGSAMTTNNILSDGKPIPLLNALLGNNGHTEDSKHEGPDSGGAGRNVSK
mgnify:CR=1 FL=1